MCSLLSALSLPLTSLPLPALHPQWFATQLLEANRPRAALRYYVRHMASEEETYDDVWFSLVNGALCVALLSERSGKVPPLQLQNSAIESVHFSRHGGWLAAGCNGRGVVLHEISSWREVSVLKVQFFYP